MNEDSEVARWERWENSEVARSEMWDGSEVASWERWEGSEVARWERWESSEVARWKVPGFDVELFQGSEMQAGFHYRDLILLIQSFLV